MHTLYGEDKKLKLDYHVSQNCLLLCFYGVLERN